MQAGLFDLEFRLDKIDANGDPLKRLNALIDWRTFRAELQAARDKDKERKSPAGRKPFDAVLMFKILILQALYGLSDDAAEYQILDRLSFMRFLGLKQGDAVPDAKTIWLFRDQLTRAEAIDALFDRFDRFLKDNGYAARRGQIVDASIVPAPVQRNTREENKAIRRGETPEGWEEHPAKLRQKDVDAAWTKKNGKSYFGYKNHVNVDVEHKLIRAWAVTDASVHDSLMLPVLLDEGNTSKSTYGDSAYRSQAIERDLREDGYRSRIHRKGRRGKKLSQREIAGNKTKSRIRARVEHVFGVMSRRAGGKVIRAVGWARTRMKIGLRNLAYNLDRYALLARRAG
jgi:IS5 family transposase